MDSGEHKHNSTFSKLLILSTSPSTPQISMSPTFLSESNLGRILLTLMAHSTLHGFANLEDEPESKRMKRKFCFFQELRNLTWTAIVQCIIDPEVVLSPQIFIFRNYRKTSGLAVCWSPLLLSVFLLSTVILRIFKMVLNPARPPSPDSANHVYPPFIKTAMLLHPVLRTDWEGVASLPYVFHTRTSWSYLPGTNTYPN